MKYIFMIVGILISSSSLNAMEQNGTKIPYGTNNVTKWKEVICKNPKEKEQLVTVYKDFCQKRVKNNIAWAAGSVVPFMFKSVRKSCYKSALFGAFALRQTYLLGRNCWRADLADKQKLYYLNQDVLEQLGSPNRDDSESSEFWVATYKNGVEQKNVFDYSIATPKFETLTTDNIDGIKEALSGDYMDSTVYNNALGIDRIPFDIEKNIELMRS